MAVMLGVTVLLATVAIAYAASERGKLSGKWFLYSGGLGDHGPATAKDTKVWMEISGPVAIQMYQRLGRSTQVKDACGVSDLKIREKGEVSCTLQDDGEAVCNVNFDLRTGRVWGGTIC
jgi:hypothetical protein